MNSLDLLIIANKNWEGWPIVAATAISVGVPIISTKSDAKNEFINNTNGYLINPGSVVEMKNALMNSIDNSIEQQNRAVKAVYDTKKYDAKID